MWGWKPDDSSFVGAPENLVTCRIATLRAFKKTGSIDPVFFFPLTRISLQLGILALEEVTTLEYFG